MLSGEYGDIYNLDDENIQSLDGPEDFNDWLKRQYDDQPVRLIILGTLATETSDDGVSEPTGTPFRSIVLYPYGKDSAIYHKPEPNP